MWRSKIAVWQLPVKSSLCPPLALLGDVMRTLLVIVVLIALMVVGGWIVFSSGRGSSFVEFRTDKAQSDVEKVIGEGEQMFNGMRRESNDATTTIENPAPAPQ